MTHSTVMILTVEKPDEEVLATALKPFDENKEVQPYRNDIAGPAASWWAVDGLRKDGLLPAGDVSWEQVRDAYITKYPESAVDFVTEVFTIDPDDPSKAFCMSTYNPQSRWDWWVIGFRWKDSLLALDGTHCDFLQRKDLDLEGMRATAGDAFRSRYWQGVEVHARWPHRSWEAMLAERGIDALISKNEVRPSLETMDALRRAYHEQRSIAEYRKLLSEDDRTWFSDWDLVLVDQKEFDRQVEIRRAAAVPCWATLDLNGRWNEPGRMGWFGMDSSNESTRIGYYEAMNGLIESLDPDTWLTVVDVHI